MRFMRLTSHDGRPIWIEPSMVDAVHATDFPETGTAVHFGGPRPALVRESPEWVIAEIERWYGDSD